MVFQILQARRQSSNRPHRRTCRLSFDVLEERTVPSGTELVVNGSFELGNTGFQSSYAYSPGNIADLSTYDITTNPADVHFSAASFGDHTTGTGEMMAVNGGQTSDLTVWSETIAVVPNSDFTVSAWVASWYPASPAQLDFSINGTSIGTITSPDATGVWQQFSGSWNSGAATSATIRIVNLNMAFSGNDFALDDISFFGPAPVPPPLPFPTDPLVITVLSDAAQQGESAEATPSQHIVTTTAPPPEDPPPDTSADAMVNAVGSSGMGGEEVPVIADPVPAMPLDGMMSTPDPGLPLQSRRDSVPTPPQPVIADPVQDMPLDGIMATPDLQARVQSQRNSAPAPDLAWEASILASRDEEWPAVASLALPVDHSTKPLAEFFSQPSSEAMPEWLAPLALALVTASPCLVRPLDEPRHHFDCTVHHC